MKFILKRKIKFYTKETLKLFNITLLSFGIILALVLIKYKPLYKVSVDGKQIGYIANKNLIQEEIKNNVEEYKSQNINTVTLENKPEYELKLVNNEQTTNEQEIIIALQKELKITYKYYQIDVNDNITENVNSLEEAEAIKEEVKQKEENANINITEKITENVDEIKTENIELAKEKIFTEIGEQHKKEEEENSLAMINNIKIANLPITGTITSRFGERSRLRSSTHTGLDISTKSGTPIKVVADGTVISAEYSGAYGNLVKIDHGNGVETWYAHTSKMYVSKGQAVSAGEVIAAVGSTGNSTGAHLHLEIRINGTVVNPQNYIYK